MDFISNREEAWNTEVSKHFIDQDSELMNIMNIRKLKEKDAYLMLEWMHDPFVVKDLRTDFSNKTIDDCYSFIDMAQNVSKNMHLAITDDNDIYMGTVSLKNIENDNAEFAITIRKMAMGKGYSKYGMEKIISIGMNELNLKKIYWCVNPTNVRACKFYNKNGYKQMNLTDNEKKYLLNRVRYSMEQIDCYKWYQVTAE